MSKYGLGLRNVGSYIGHTQPYVFSGRLADPDHPSGTRNEQVHSFPYVTRSITVKNNSGNPGKAINISFDSRDTTAHGPWPIPSNITNGHHVVGTNKLHMITLTSGEEITLNVKTDKIFLSPARGNGNLLGQSRSGVTVFYSIFAELTNIPTGSMYTLEGSGITE